MTIIKKLFVKKEAFQIPCYSLSSDLIGYRQCPLQYRFRRISQLPPSRPVQMWFGEFVHFVLEHSFKYFKNSNNKLPDEPLLKKICEKVRKKLATRGIFPRNRKIYQLAVDRIKLINELICPDLFQLMEHAEKKVRGTERFSKIYSFLPSNLYELTGIIDILSKNKLKLHDKIYKGNLIKKKILEKFEELKKAIPSEDDEYEIIVDYKGMHRPPINAPRWDDHILQLNLYKLLREKQPDSNKVIAGILIYINEILPTKTDLKKIHKNIKNTDVKPKKGSNDESALKNQESEKLSNDFKIDRTVRIEILEDTSKTNALKEFEETIIKIESRKKKEKIKKNIINAWLPTNPPDNKNNIPDKDTCAACDHRFFCPDSPRKGTPEPPFDYTASFAFLKKPVNLDFFSRDDPDIKARVNKIPDTAIIHLSYDDDYIKAEVSDYEIIIDFNKKAISHPRCVDFQRNRRRKKTFCKHIYKLFTFLMEVELGDDIVLEILQEIADDLTDWTFES